MHIDVIENKDAFAALRRNWDAVYDADPEAHFFTSWQWLADWLAVYWTTWFVLAAKRDPSDTEYVAFLPMRLRADFDKKLGLRNELVFAGTAFSDYTGILTRPEDEAEAIPALAEHIKRLNWALLTLDNMMMSEQRRRLFLKVFDQSRFNHTNIDHKYREGRTDHNICPIADLPGSWEDYLRTLSSNNRQKVRRLLKKLETSKDCRITVADAATLDSDLKALLHHWKVKWAPVKGEKTAESVVANNYKMLMRCAENGTLFLPVFRHRDRPVAALASFIDRSKKSLLFFITGRDESYSEMPSGYLLHAFSIRHAIAEGLTTYDFLRGNEPYKYHFASRERHLTSICVSTKTNRNLGGVLDPRGVPAMLGLTLVLENEGKIKDAERAYRQILEFRPDDALALYRFALLMVKNADYAEAKALLVRSVKAQPEGGNAWFLLAQTLQTLGEIDAALDACRKVIELQPQNEEAKELMLQLSRAAKPADQRATLAVQPIKTPRPLQSPIDTGLVDPYWSRVRQLTASSVGAPLALPEIPGQAARKQQGPRRKP